MMQAELYFYPDTRKKACYQIGSMLYGKPKDQDTPGFLIAFYGTDNTAVSALTHSKVLQGIMQDVAAFVQRHLARVAFSPTHEENELTAEIMSCLPENFRMGKAVDWPAEKLVVWMAEHQGAKTHAVTAEQTLALA